MRCDFACLLFRRMQPQRICRSSEKSHFRLRKLTSNAHSLPLCFATYELLTSPVTYSARLKAEQFCLRTNSTRPLFTLHASAKKMKAKAIAEALEEYITPLKGKSSDTYDYSEILKLTSNKRFVLIGEASHGTHEFYEIRAEITKRLIDEQGFMAVAVEADWPDAYRVNRKVQAESDKLIPDANCALDEFKRFPTWMWRNTEVASFINWLHARNKNLASSAAAGGDASKKSTVKAGFYGLDLYSLHTSIAAVVKYLEGVDPVAAKRAKLRYGCFAQYGDDPQQYGMATALGVDQGCAAEIITQLKDLQQHVYDYTTKIDGQAARDEFFSAEQNAKLIIDAERYYRAMFSGRPNSWNVRDTHMADTLDALAEHLEKTHARPAKIVVWAHNSHIGDASATDMSKRKEISIGQLTRERHADETCLIGFSTYNGTVTAADEWDEPEHHKQVNDALPGSVESILHQIAAKNFILNLRDNPQVQELLSMPALQRFIGVIYRRDTERWSHYYDVRLADEFDAIIHIDKTRALTPLDPSHRWHTARREMDDTYPTGL